MFEMIPAKDYRRIIEKQGIELSDWDKAALIIRGLLYMMKVLGSVEVDEMLERLQYNTFPIVD